TGPDAEELESTSSEEADELAFSSDMPHLYPREPRTCNEAVSKWQLKGKRNNRNLVKRSAVASDRRGAVLYGADVEGQRRHLNHQRSGVNYPYYRNDYSDAPDDTDQMFGSEDEYSPTPRAVAKGQNKNFHSGEWDEWPWEDQPALKGYSPLYSDHYQYDGMKRSVLVDVDLKVQTSYKKEPVPIVSITSKLNGRSILGRPIQIESLKDGSTDNLFSTIDDYSNDGIGYEGSGVLPPAWRTARRTANFRVPRPHIQSSNVDEGFSIEQERNTEYKRLNGGNSSHNASYWKKNNLNSVGPSIDKKSFKKSAKKASLSSSQKTRTLSSLSIEDNLSRKQSLTRSFYPIDKLSKPEVSGLTTVACIPVKLVYSRLLEKINRPPLKVSTNVDALNTEVPSADQRHNPDVVEAQPTKVPSPSSTFLLSRQDLCNLILMFLGAETLFDRKKCFRHASKEIQSFDYPSTYILLSYVLSYRCRLTPERKPQTSISPNDSDHSDGSHIFSSYKASTPTKPKRPKKLKRIVLKANTSKTKTAGAEAQVHEEVVETTPSIEATSARDVDALETGSDPLINITSHSTPPDGFNHFSTAHTRERNIETNREPATDNAHLHENPKQQALIGDDLVHSNSVNTQFHIL
ncbi:hypothetical protein RYX36_003039, partial [Vicia faba]